MATRVYKYGLLAPTQNAELVREQMLFAHRYRNTLTEIERGRRAAERSILSECGDLVSLEGAVFVADEAVREAARAIKSERAKTRSRTENETARDTLKDARTTLKDARAKLGEFRRQLREDPDIIAKLAVINGAKAPKVEGAKARDNTKKNDGRAAQLVRSAREYNGLFWGTYLLVERAMQAARTAPLYDGAEPNDPRFVRWGGAGTVGVQIQSQSGEAPFESEHVFGNDLRVRVAPLDERAWTAESRGERRRLSRTTLQLRIGSEGPGNRTPVWASWPMIMHRPMAAGVVKWVSVSVRRIGPREEWTVCFTVDEADALPVGPSTDVAVAVHYGWLSQDDGLRVATCLDDSGERLDLTLDKAILSAIAKADELRATRDDGFNAGRAELAAWLKDRTLPDWLTAATKTLDQWRSAGRLAALAKRWRTERWDGDAAGYDALEAWRYHDHHLWAWETSQRSKALRRRKDLYRKHAKDLAERYATLILHDFDLRSVARKKPTEADGEAAQVRSNRQRAAISELRLAMVDAFKRRGRDIKKTEAAGVSQSCPACGSEHESQKNVAAHWFACGECECGFERELDTVALMNVLLRAGMKKAVAEMVERGKRAAEQIRSAKKEAARAAGRRAKTGDRSQAQIVE